MKRLATSVFLIFAVHFTYAQQFAIINDKDGYVNVHEDADVKSKIIGKIDKDSLFAYDGENVAWNYVSTNNLFGYVSHNRIFPLSNFPALKLSKVFKDSCIIGSDVLLVKIKKTKFIAMKHLVRRKGGFVNLIDGRKVWGTDGDLPKNVVSKIEVTIKGENVPIPSSAFVDLLRT